MIPRRLLAAIGFFYFAAGNAAAQLPDSTPAARILVTLAGDVSILSPNEFLYGFRGRPSWMPREAQPALARLANAMEGRPWTSSEVLPLLDHTDPNVRTLALIAAYYADDPQLLPHIAALVDDPAQTFPAAQPHAAPMGWNIPTVLKSQTVGEFATAIVNVYLESGGFHYGPGGLRGQPGFREYWKARASRASTAGWWYVRLGRAGGRSSPTMAERRPALRALRARIDRLDEPERTYVLLWLHGENGAEVVVSDEDLLASLRRLGRGSLLALLQRNIRSDDPDLQPRPANNFRYAQMCRFVLTHAGSLLRPEDAPTLLAQEAYERDHQKHGITDPMITPWWAIAAADLNPAAASSMLRAAYERSQGQYDGSQRLELAEAIWRQTADAQAASDWFFQRCAGRMGWKPTFSAECSRSPDDPPIRS